MHVYSQADHPGEPTLVFVAGMGLGSAYYELESVWKPLAEDVNVATVDYLGYGFSGTTAKDRTSEAVATEIHAALHGAGVEGPVRAGGPLPRRALRAGVRRALPRRGRRVRRAGQHLARSAGPGGLRGRSSPRTAGSTPPMSVARFVGLVRVDHW